MIGRRRRAAARWAHTASATGLGIDLRRDRLGPLARRGARWAVAPAACSYRRGLLAFAPASWLAGAVASATNQAAPAAGRRARHALVGQRRGGAHRRPRQPRCQRPARPARLDHRPRAWPRLGCAPAPDLLHQRHAALQHQARLRPRHARAAPGRLDRPVAHGLAGRPGHALEHHADGRQLRLASPGLSVESGARAAGAWRPRRHRPARRLLARLHARDAGQLPPHIAANLRQPARSSAPPRSRARCSSAATASGPRRRALPRRGHAPRRDRSAAGQPAEHHRAARRRGPSFDRMTMKPHLHLAPRPPCAPRHAARRRPACCRLATARAGPTAGLPPSRAAPRGRRRAANR